MDKQLELLAPVGKMESLYAAVQNGANAVYLGGKLFNARHYASNFSDEEMLEAVNYAHLRDVKLYVTVNILIDEGEMDQALDYIKYLYDIGVDGIIVQDIGLAYLVHNILPDLEIHGSTQMTINNAEGAEFLYEQGFSRVVLSRETPLEEIRRISETTDIELEIFIHGALCVSYSGQCLMSSMIGGRSGNRGRCAQPCRMPSSLVNARGEAIEDWENKHILSPKDLNTLEEIEDLIKAGVVSFKIEGRMKRPEYVATVVDIYRRALDLGYESLEDRDLEDIRQIFNRGFTGGLGFKDFGRNFISYDRPDNRGIYLGRVMRVKREKVEVQLDEVLSIGDGVEFRLGQDKYKGMRSDLAGQPGDIVEFKKIGDIKPGDQVYRSSSQELLQRAQASYEEDQLKKTLDLDLEIKLGERPRIRASYQDITVSYEDDYLVEESKNKPLEEDRVIDQLEKLGDTVYRLEKINLKLDDNVFMPVSKINELRRNITERMDREILSGFLKREVGQEEFGRLKEEFMNFESVSCQRKIISSKLESLDILKSLDLDQVDRVYLNFYEDPTIDQALEYLRGRNLEVFIASEKILYDSDIKALREFLDARLDLIDGVSVSNLGSFALIRKNYDLLIHGDIGMNIFNSYSMKFLSENKMTSCNLSAELNLGQIEKIMARASMEAGVIVYGYIPVMVTRHCPMSLVKGCLDDSQCRTCQFRQGYRIRDRVGAEFRMLRKTGFTNIYNSVPVMVLDDLKNISAKGLTEFRLDFSFEDERAKDLLSSYYDHLNDHMTMEEVRDFISDFKRTEAITKGHFFRGIIE